MAEEDVEADDADGEDVRGEASAWVGTGGFTVTSTCVFSDEMCQGKGPLFETSTRDELSVPLDMSGNSEVTTVDSEITKLSLSKGEKT